MERALDMWAQILNQLNSGRATQTCGAVTSTTKERLRPVDRSRIQRLVRSGPVRLVALSVGAAVALALVTVGSASSQTNDVRRSLQASVAQGWSTWSNRSVTTHVQLPSALALRIGFKQQSWLDEELLQEVLIGRQEEGAEQVRPGLHALDGSITELDIEWRGVRARVRSAHAGGDLVVLLEPYATSRFGVLESEAGDAASTAAKQAPQQPVEVIVEAGFLWNRPGIVEYSAEILRAESPRGAVSVFTTADTRTADPFIPSFGRSWVLPFSAPLGLSTGKQRSLEEIRAAIAEQERAALRRAQRFGDLAEAAAAIESGLAWNTVYDPSQDRVLLTVGRLWNLEYGGFSLFGWDNFFLAYASALFDHDLAWSGMLEHLAGITEEGFVPNDHGGNGRKSWDHSQPPVGSLMVWALQQAAPNREALNLAFEDLLRWNRWWPKRRLNGDLLSYGSHAAKNPFGETHRETMIAAGYESGMDDSPMYEGVPFDPKTNTMALQDVGLNALYIADCSALAEIADELGKGTVARELRERAALFSGALEQLWSEDFGLYLNRATDGSSESGALSQRLSPTLFYPMLAGAASTERSRRMVRDHLTNEEEFWGEFVLPSIARNDPAFDKQRYWKGAIWPPLNFLVYLSLQAAGSESEFVGVRSELARRSLDLFLAERRRMGYVSENYSSITGRGDDPRLSSDRFHSWGVLMGLMAFLEEGFLD